MRRKRTVTPDMLADAVLGGLPCKAIAWIEATHVDVLERKGRTRPVEGIRTWHGTAVIDEKDFPAGQQWFSHAVEYAGKLIDGEETRDIRGEVYITSIRRHKTRTVRSGLTGQEVDLQVHVEFTGAGTLFPRG